MEIQLRGNYSSQFKNACEVQTMDQTLYSHWGTGRIRNGREMDFPACWAPGSKNIVQEKLGYLPLFSSLPSHPISTSGYGLADAGFDSRNKGMMVSGNISYQRYELFAYIRE